MKHTLRLLIAVLTSAALTSGLYAQTAPQLFQQALSKEQAEGKLQEAIQLYQRVVNDAAADRALKARALLQIGRCHEKLGTNEARKAYDQIVRQFADQQAPAAEARTRLSAMTSATVAAPPPGPVARRLDLLWGTPSPDGQYYAYPDGYGLSIRNLKSGDTRRIMQDTKAEYFEGEFAWTRDSKRVVYNVRDGAEQRPENQMMHVRLSNIDGSGTRVLVSQARAYLAPFDCSRDGRFVAIVGNVEDGPMQFSVLPLAGGQPRVIKTFQTPTPTNRIPGAAVDGWPERLVFSPDAKHLVYSLRTPLTSQRKDDVFILTVDGGQDSRLIQHPADDHFLDWTPDGRGVLFTSDRSGTVDVWLAPIDGGSVTGLPLRLKKDVGRLSAVGITADGAFYYQTRGSGSSEVFVAAVDPQTGQTRGPASPISQTHGGTNAAPKWSPDGRSLAYRARTSSAPWYDTITVLASESGEQRQVRTGGSTQWAYFNWHPDGRSFLVDAGFGPKTEDAPKGVFQVDAATGTVRQLVPRQPDQPATEATWIDGGRAIMFVSQRRSLVVFDVASGAERVLYDAGPDKDVYLTSLAISPDGQHVAFRLYVNPNLPRDSAAPGRRRAFMIMPIAGGEPRELATHNDRRVRWGQIAWAPDGRHLYFVDRALPAGGPTIVHGETMELWRIAASGGKAHKTGIAMTGNIGGLSVHPDGTRIAFDGPYVEPAIWVLENFLPKK